MKPKFSQYQRLLQKMALTPRMVQSIKFLSMSTKDLHEYVETAVEANPFLKKEFDRERAERYRAQKGAKPVTDEYDYTANIRQKENPRSPLISQIRVMGLADKALEIAEYLIYEMDDNGYITVDLGGVADELSVDINEVERVLDVIQRMEPAGIGARNVQECLELQLERKGKKDSLEYRIVTEFINELARNDIERISKSLNIDKGKAQKAIDALKKLNPRPASSILSKETTAVIPDLIAEVKEDSINLRLNRDWLPNIGFHNPYENEPAVVQDLESKKFIKENMDSAKGVIDNLKRREDTLYKVADYIINFQRDSFCGGGRSIKTLMLKEVAGALNLHTSTISRAVSNKYIQINNEVMALKALLSKGIKREGGETTSKAAIKSKIRTLIKDEDTARPLSDEDVKISLEKEGIEIKRRTIAKYRNSLRILPAYLRKKK